MLLKIKALMFLITPLKMLCAIDVAFKSYERKCSESSEMGVTTISELSRHFCVYLLKAMSLGPNILQGVMRKIGAFF